MSRAESAILDGLEAEILGGNFQFLGEGNFASVMVLDRSRYNSGPEGGSVEGQVVVKRLKVPEGISRIRRETMVELLRVEMHMQEHARRLIILAREREAEVAQREGRPPKEFAFVPRPVALMHGNKEILMVMDRVPGMTLFQKAAKEWLNGVLGEDFVESAEDIKRVMRQSMSDERAERFVARVAPEGVRIGDMPPAMAEKRIYGSDVISVLPNSLLNNAVWKDPATPVMFLQLAMAARQMRVDEEFPIVSPEQTEAVKNSIKVLNNGGLLHGDLHGNNVMQQPDGKMAIIDFGAARMTTSSDKELERRRERVSMMMRGHADRSRSGVSDMQIVNYMRSISRRRNLSAIRGSKHYTSARGASGGSRGSRKRTRRS